MTTLDLPTIRSRFTALCDEALRRNSATLTPEETMALLDGVIDQMAAEFGDDVRVQCWIAIARAVAPLYPDSVIPLN